MYIEPSWPVPKNVKSVITTRLGGVSETVFSSMNTAMHVGDDPLAVARNRHLLESYTGLSIRFLKQVHGTRVHQHLAQDAHNDSASDHVEADAVYASSPGLVCAVQTADCLPLLACSRNGEEVASVHAGWRGLQKGIISSMVQRFQAPPDHILVFLGPAISQAHFEVGGEVVEAFSQSASARNWSKNWYVESVARGMHKNKYMLNIYALAEAELKATGVHSGNIHGGGMCTHTDSRHFFSYRRDGSCGRMASLIWRAS